MHRSGGTAILAAEGYDPSHIMSPPVELVLTERDLISTGCKEVLRLGVEAEEVVRKSKIRRLVLRTDRIVDLSRLRVILVPEINEVTEIICDGSLVVDGLHATNIKVEGCLLASFGLVSTDPEGWLAVGQDMISAKIFGNDIAVGGTLSAEALAGDNIFADRVYIGQLVGGINSITVPTERHFDGEFCTRGVYIGSAKEISLHRSRAESLNRFKQLLESGLLPGVSGAAFSFDLRRLRRNGDLTMVGPKKIGLLRAKVNRKVALDYGIAPEMTR